tara:strand:+ start:36981 stop:37574 length:594 start_codon:yes stop_codon:yes gene_type:complete
MLLGLGGGACSGKTTLARALVALEPEAAVLSFDDYYRDLAHMSPEQRAEVNYDHPDALDTTLFLTHMDALAAGNPADVPVYDMATHTRTGGTHRVEPAPLVIVDGILLLVLEECRDRLDFKIFIEAPKDIRLQRRLVRDVAERGRDKAGIEKQFSTSVQPMHEQLVAPSSVHADLVVSYPWSAEAVAQDVIERMRNL